MGIIKMIQFVRIFQQYDFFSFLDISITALLLENTIIRKKKLIAENVQNYLEFPQFKRIQTQKVQYIYDQKTAKMIWCHACQKQTTTSQYSNTCLKCGSAAIQKMDENCSQAPNQFNPYIIGQQRQSNQVSQSHIPNEEQEEIDIPIVVNIRTVLLQSLDHPGQFTVIRVVSSNLPANSDSRTPVPQETIKKLEKVQTVKQCTICHQEGGTGLKLKCSHCFHQNCLKPWFQQANTCPTCRTQIK